MAGISAIQRLLDNLLTSKFARSLKHSDLPEGWADNPEIVALAEDAYREMGTESPFFKAWGGNSKVVDEAGEPLKVYHGSAVIRKSIIPLIAGGAVMAPREAQGMPYQFPADKRGTARYEHGLESPTVDPIDVLLAPIGVVGASAKAAAMAAEPFISYGLDKAIGGILSLFGDEEE